MANIYVIQPAFTTGEISPAVGSRVDLEQYKSALLNAENTVIRPLWRLLSPTGVQVYRRTEIQR